MRRKTLGPCAEPGCPDLTREGYCPKHSLQRDTNRPTATARGYDNTWRKTRAAYLRAHPTCQDEAGCIAAATDVDHIDGKGPNGPNGHNWDNLRGLCHSHHSQRTARDQPGGWNKGSRATRPFIILCGAPGTGKTEVRNHLARLIGAAPLGPDDYDNGWFGLYNELDLTQSAIVECNRLPAALRRKAKARGATIILLQATAETRATRLAARGETENDITRLLRPLGPLGYEDHIEPHLTLNTDTEPAEAVARQAAEYLRQ